MKPKDNIPAMSGVAEVGLVYHSKVKPCDRPKILNTEQAYQFFVNYWNKDSIELVEESKVLLMNNRGHALGLCDISKGGITATIVDPRLVYIAALRTAACAVILAHNHPSGDTCPSAADHSLTQKLKAGAELLDIRLLDHLIITPEHFFSFANAGLL